MGGLGILLAQLGTDADVPRLPAPPLTERFLFESPLPVAVLLVLAGLISAAVLNRRGRAGAGLIAAGVLALLAAGVFLLATLVTTDRERLRVRTRAVMAAAAGVDLTALNDLLSDDALLLVSESRLGPMGQSVGPMGDPLGKPAILARVEDLLGREYRVHEHTVLTVQAAMNNPSVGKTQVCVRIVPEFSRIPNKSWWRLTWHNEDGVWRVSTIEPLWIAGLGG